MTFISISDDLVDVKQGEPSGLECRSVSDEARAAVAWLSRRTPVMAFPDMAVRLGNLAIRGIVPTGTYREVLLAAPLLPHVSLSVGLTVVELVGTSGWHIQIVDGRIVQLAALTAASPEIDLPVSVSERDALPLLLGAPIYSLRSVAYSLSDGLLFGNFLAAISAPSRHIGLRDVAAVTTELLDFRLSA